MAYTDPLIVRQFATTLQNAAAGAIVDDDSAVSTGYELPGGGSIEAFGLTETVASGTVTNNLAQFGLFIASAVGSAFVQVATITVSTASGVLSSPVLVGTRLECTASAARALRLLPGALFQVQKVDAAAGTGTASWKPYVIVRLDGYTGQKPGGVQMNPLSPVFGFGS